MLPTPVLRLLNVLDGDYLESEEGYEGQCCPPAPRPPLRPGQPPGGAPVREGLGPPVTLPGFTGPALSPCGGVWGRPLSPSVTGWGGGGGWEEKGTRPG